MVTISFARRNKVKDSIIKEQLIQSIINDLKINIEETQDKLKRWELQLIKLKQQERILFSDKFQDGDKVLYTNKGFFDKKVGTFTQIKKYKLRQTQVYVLTLDEKIIYRSPKNLEFYIQSINQSINQSNKQTNKQTIKYKDTSIKQTIPSFNETKYGFQR